MSAAVKIYKLTSKFLVDYNNDVANKVKEALDLNESDYSKIVEVLKIEDFADLKKMTRRGGANKGATRAPTAYNLFVQKEIKALKEANPSMDRKELMRKAAAKWTEEKQKAAAQTTEVKATKKKK